MIAEEYLNRSRLFRRLRNGPHGLYVELCASQLVKIGLSRRGTWRSLNLIGDLLNWLARIRSTPTDLNERMVELYLRRRSGGTEAFPIDASRGGRDRAGGHHRSHRMSRSSTRSASICGRNEVWRRSPSSTICRSFACSFVRSALAAPATFAGSAKPTSRVTSSAMPEIRARRPASRCVGRCDHFSDISIIGD